MLSLVLDSWRFGIDSRPVERRLSKRLALLVLLMTSLLLWAVFWFAGVFVLTLVAALMP